MNDLTLLYYTDNTLEENTRRTIADRLIEVTENRYPIISVSQKPIDLGENVCVGEIGKSKYNMYKQVLIGLNKVKTEYVACIDDDTLYAPEHFTYRPPSDSFAYETNYWFAMPHRDYFWRVHEIEKRGGMWGCISNTHLLLENLTQRFKCYPTDPFATDQKLRLVWGEPGINDTPYKIRNAQYTRFFSPKPCVVFIHSRSMGFNQFWRWHRRYGLPLPDDRADYLDNFGTLKDVFNKYFPGYE